MRTAINPKHASIEQCCTWLAEQPCPDTQCINGIIRVDREDMSGPYSVTPTELYTHETCQGLGLAFPWASEECVCRKIISLRKLHKERQLTCNGSGHVPKAAGLAELFEHGGLTLVGRYSEPPELYWAKAKRVDVLGEANGETPTLAALRAVVVSLQSVGGV